MTSTSSKPHDLQALDNLTGGAFTASTSGERAGRIRDWLAGNPSTEQMQEVFKELSGRDKGAARLLREKLDELKRAKGQEAIGAEWAQKAQALLAQPKLNIADALAWQRDAAKAGAPLSREPLTGLKGQLVERVKGIEDLQHRAQVHREAAVLLAQRFEVLSTKSWLDAQAAEEGLRGDVVHWKEQADAIAADANWNSLDARFAPQLDASKAQLLVVSDAFHGALAQAQAAAAEAAAPLPPVLVWADELRAARGEAVAPKTAPAKPAGPKIDPSVRAAAQEAVQAALGKLEQETAEGHGKASAGAAASLRMVLKQHGKLVESELEARVHAALVAAGELEGWQRWSADKVREDLVARAEGLLKRPEGQALGGRKMQETLRALRDQWKQADQGGVPNHGLWKRFDEACNEAHKVVEAWLDKVRADATEHRAQRIALIDEVKAWAEAHADASDLKAHHRGLHQFADRWRDAGHIGEKVSAELQPLWNAAFDAARAPFELAQKESVDRRQAMIAEATELGGQPMLRIDAVKALQQRWQAEAQAVPLDRRHEQKLWDAFRAPIDDAFNRKTAEREKASSAMSEHDRYVLDASKALDAANAAGDVQKIRGAIARLEGAIRGEAPPPAPAPVPPARAAARAAPMEGPDGPNVGATEQIGVEQAADEFGEGSQLSTPPADAALEGGREVAAEAQSEVPDVAAAPVGPHDLIAPADSSDASSRADNEVRAEEIAEASVSTQPVEPAAAPKPAPKPVVAARRGDDRPGSNRGDAMPASRGGGKFGDRRDSRGPGGPGGPNDRGPRSGDSRGGDRFGDRAPRFEDRGPRLGDTAFRAQREALERADMALRKLAAQAHGEALSQVMGAWEQRDASQLPSVQELGRAVSPAVRSAWSQSLAGAPAAKAEDASEALLRLEMAAEVPTPADQLDARRALQLKLLTKRGDPAPAQTWGRDAGKVLAMPHDPTAARRFQNALKALLRK